MISTSFQDLKSFITGPSSGAEKTTKKPAADKADDKAVSSANPAYSISESMEKLLDGLTGAKPKAKAADSDSASNDDAPSSGGGSAQGNPELARAQEAERIMRTAHAMGKAFADSASSAADLLTGDLGKVMGMFGASQDDIDSVTKDFAKELQNTLSGTDFNQMSLDMQQTNMSFTLESRGIDLTIQDGDRKMTISFAQSTLDFHSDSAQLQAQVGADGSSAVALGTRSISANAEATGMIVRTEGFSDDEVQSMLDGLNSMIGQGGSAGLSGLAVLTPTKKADGILQLKLDLSSPALSALKGSAAPAASAISSAPAAAQVSTTPALDVVA